MPNAAPTHARVLGGPSGAVSLSVAGATMGARGMAGSSEGDGGIGWSAKATAGFSIGASANGTSRVRSGGGGTSGRTFAADAETASVTMEATRTTASGRDVTSACRRSWAIAEPRLHRGRPVARPVPQRRVGGLLATDS